MRRLVAQGSESRRRAAGHEGSILRFDEFAIFAGVDGTANVMQIMLGSCRMAEPPPRGHDRDRPVFVNASKWVRAPEGGVLRTTRRIGDAVSEGDVIGFIANPYEDQDAAVRAPRRGLIIGRTTLPIAPGTRCSHRCRRSWLRQSLSAKGARPLPSDLDGTII
jgi:predicted deacylase